ncbi:hypothetical protein [Streptomyces sp. NBC_01465]|uniref:hypothetical protein n=1 Tax=Streptomyces sp. NBC_01465 TaxID=2903878 RepID=UPI002E36F02C|nr:hypothetical protein [Streptomyces sp. NBC_01465]
MSDFILLLFGVVGASLMIQAVWDLKCCRQTGSAPADEVPAVAMALGGAFLALAGLVVAFLVSPV